MQMGEQEMLRLSRISGSCGLVGFLLIGSSLALAGPQDTFCPPLRKVLSMNPEQFVVYYAAHTEEGYHPRAYWGKPVIAAASRKVAGVETLRYPAVRPVN